MAIFHSICKCPLDLDAITPVLLTDLPADIPNASFLIPLSRPPRDITCVSAQRRRMGMTSLVASLGSSPLHRH